MPDAPIPLSPDDDQQTTVELVTEPQPDRARNSLVAVMASLLLLVLIRGIVAHTQVTLLLYLTWLLLAIVGGVACYILLQVTRPLIPLRLLAVVAAELGMLYSYPAYNLYIAAWQDRVELITLLWWGIMAGIAGVILPFWLRIEDRSSQTITICFLTLFVLVGLRFLL